jgi:hypothetical protein
MCRWWCVTIRKKEDGWQFCVPGTQTMKDAKSHRNSYVIRIWREDGKPGWHGWIQHARTGESALVRQVDELLAFIERRTGKLTEPKQKGLK